MTSPYFPAGEESHQPSDPGEIQAVDVNKMLNGFNNPQVIEGIEAAFGRGSERNDEPLFVVETKGGDGNS
jgi:hypothetical protein